MWPSQCDRGAPPHLGHWELRKQEILFARKQLACQTLRNYSSLHAILSALQSVSIHCLEKTWEKVSRKPLKIFQKLCSKDTTQGRNLLIKGNEINHQKRNKEYQVMAKIMLLQVASENYTLEPEDPFRAWFQAMEPLSEAER
ncbi:ral guanine nucleotide dissociation stimulator-like isoform X2 [Ursus americanus]|uniref:ral guanine nucleotide dissociation stimulator-like isoform X2 n=1 Tax=Ursus americanus TaxID=9643 RepID=UPI001E67BA74|nr:ral guanine nucleotide dissociation stimulator-like isoform X2 [Ursus americanus]